MGTIQDMINKLERFKNEIESLSNIKIPIIPDKNGMIDRQCPKTECKSIFKVSSTDWKNIFKDEEVFCPFCRNNSPAKEYLPEDQRTSVVNNIRRSVSDFWNHGHSISLNMISIESREEFELKIQCEKCNVHFAVIGAAYFCPCCGYNSIERTAQESIEKIILKANKISIIQESLESKLSKDEAAIITRSIIENSIPDCISTLQSFSELKYNSISNTKAPFNAFQNIEKSNTLWMLAKNENYSTWLTKNELDSLSLFTLRRHLLEHKGGIVDLKYLQNSGDKNYKEGDRIIVTANDVELLGTIVLKLLNQINKP